MAIVGLIIMILLIVGLDFFFLRDHFVLRLIINVVIVAAFAALYFIFLRN